jgi:two-component system, chemotaxis family, sensor kinase CheA
MAEPHGGSEGVQAKAQEGAVLQTLGERMDALSTRLLLHGVGAVEGGDFAALSDAAAADRVEAVAAVAQRLARQVAAATETEAEPKQREALVSRGLEELRSLLEARPLLEVRPSGNHASRAQPVGATLQAFAEDQEMIAEFVAEAREHLAAIVAGVLELEKDSVSGEEIHGVFRSFHTIKGLAGFLEFSQIQKVAHEVETLLDLARTGRLTITPPVVDVVLGSTDYLRQEIAGIEQRLKGGAGEAAATGGGNAALLARIRAASVGANGLGVGPQRVEGSETRDAAPVAEEARASQTRPATATLETEALETTALETTALETAATCAMTKIRERRKATETRANAAVSGVPAEPHAALSAVTQAEGAAAVPIREERRASDVTSVRIETAKLDHLMNMVGEMVIAQTLISHNPNLAVVRDGRLLGDLTQLTRITAEVQKITTSMRMVPIGQQFQRMARLIRDLARKAEKQIVLVTSGEETELDKTIAEQLSDPLLHAAAYGAKRDRSWD